MWGRASVSAERSSERGSHVPAYVDDFRRLAIVPFMFLMKKMRACKTEAATMH
jgi:hypothetical protein